jgi:hypothetical protein
MIAVTYAGLCLIQQRRLTIDFAALLALPRDDLPVEREPQGDGSVLLRVPLTPAQQAMVDGKPDSMTDDIAQMGLEYDVRAMGDRMVMTIDGASCPRAPARVQMLYDRRPHVWQPLDGALIVAPGDIGIFPAFYRATQNFAGVLLPASHAQCDVRLARVPLTHDLPLVLTAVLPPDWRSLPLRKGLGGFSAQSPQ